MCRLTGDETRSNSANVVCVYTNGVLKNTYTSNLSRPSDTSQAHFMHDGNILSTTPYTSNYTSLYGYVDDYRIYNSVLSNTQISSIYSE